ncbi:MAG: hypothetical protein BWY66_00384 [bacterium ADurb.Bin374]|nr:MAG: hypothetical protein BWY66_00384 [bacterium ADurb.Bin374]
MILAGIRKGKMKECILIEYDRVRVGDCMSMWSWTIWKLADGKDAALLVTDDSHTLEQAKVDARLALGETGWEKDDPFEIVRDGYSESKRLFLALEGLVKEVQALHLKVRKDFGLMKACAFASKVIREIKEGSGK